MMSLLNYITWTVEPEIFTIGNFSVRWYGLFFALAFVFGQRILTHIYKAEGRTEEDVDIITIYMIVGTVIGARLGHVLFYQPDYYLSNPLAILKIWEGGLASHGATIGILLALYLFSRKYKFNYMWVLDRIVIVVALGGAFIRMGNLMNHEIIGKPTNLPWGFYFTRNNEIINGVSAAADPRHPAQLYESLVCVVLFLGLYWLWSKRKSLTPRGSIFGLFVTVLFLMRFLIEFLKEDQVDFEGQIPLNMGQWLSIPLILIGIIILVRALRQPAPVPPKEL